MRLLWVGPKSPFPARDGATKASMVLLDELAALGCDLRVFALNSDGVQEAPPCASSFETFAVPMRSQWRLRAPFLLLSSAPVTVKRFESIGLRKRLLEHGSWADAIVFDGLHPAINLAQEDELPPIVYRAHNAEWQIWQEKAGQPLTLLTRALFRSQYRKVRKFEENLCQRSSLVATVSDEDARLLSPASSDESVITVPIGERFEDTVPERAGGNRRVLFVGSSTWAPNRDAAKFLLRECFSQQPFDRFQLTLVGRGWRTFCEEQRTRGDIQPLDWVEDLSSVYGDHDVAVLPIAYGSGTRVKAIEAIAAGIPVLSTAKGVEGLRLQAGSEYVEFELSADSFLAALESMENESLYHEIRGRAFDRLRSSHDSAAAAKRFYLALKQKLGNIQKPSRVESTIQ